MLVVEDVRKWYFEGELGNCMPILVNPRIMHAKKGIKKNTVSGVATHAKMISKQVNACQYLNFANDTWS